MGPHYHSGLDQGFGFTIDVDDTLFLLGSCLHGNGGLEISTKKRWIYSRQEDKD